MQKYCGVLVSFFLTVLAHLFVKRQSILMVVFASSFGISITKYLIQNTLFWEKATVYA